MPLSATIALASLIAATGRPDGPGFSTAATGHLDGLDQMTDRRLTASRVGAPEFSPVYRCLLGRQFYDHLSSGCARRCPKATASAHGQCVREETPEPEARLETSWQLSVQCGTRSRPWRPCWNDGKDSGLHSARLSFADHLDIPFQEVEVSVGFLAPPSRRLTSYEPPAKTAYLTVKVTSNRMTATEGQALLGLFPATASSLTALLGLDVRAAHPAFEGSVPNLVGKTVMGQDSDPYMPAYEAIEGLLGEGAVSPPSGATPSPRGEGAASPTSGATPAPRGEGAASPPSGAPPAPRGEGAASPTSGATPPPRGEGVASPPSVAPPAPRGEGVASPTSGATPPPRGEGAASPPSGAPPPPRGEGAPSPRSGGAPSPCELCLLPREAIIGIAVGVVVFALVAGGMLWRRRRQRRAAAQVHQAKTVNENVAKTKAHSVPEFDAAACV